MRESHFARGESLFFMYFYVKMEMWGVLYKEKERKFSIISLPLERNKLDYGPCVIDQVSVTV